MDIINDPTDIFELLNKTMNQKDSVFISRIGGSDFKAVAEYIDHPGQINSSTWVDFHLKKVRDLNGYFDFESKLENFEKYLNLLYDSYKSSDIIAYAGKTITNFEKTKSRGTLSFPENQKKLIREVCSNKRCVDWQSLCLNPRQFLDSMKVWAKDKKILVVSPFSESISLQFEKKDNLFHNFVYPKFHLVTYTSSVTYNNNEDTPSSLSVSTSDWIEECQKMMSEISQLDFDVALLSCGSYALPLGNFISNALQKKAIYTGVAINYYFNIYGENLKDRYEPFGCNLDYQIDALEYEKVRKIKGGKQYGEGISAYFGRRKHKG